LQVIACIWKHPHAPFVYLVCDLLAHEDVLIEVSRTFGSKIYVDQKLDCFKVCYPSSRFQVCYPCSMKLILPSSLHHKFALLYVFKHVRFNCHTIWSQYDFVMFYFHFKAIRPKVVGP
jgi:hypothetical protein